MKVFKCDLCGQEVGEYKLETLREKFLTKKTKDVCPACKAIIDNFIIRVHAGISDAEGEAVRIFIERLESVREAQ